MLDWKKRTKKLFDITREDGGYASGKQQYQTTNVPK